MWLISLEHMTQKFPGQVQVCLKKKTPSRTGRRGSGAGDINLIALIQEQQQLLQTVLSNQTKMTSRQDEFQSKLTELRSKVVNSCSGSSPDSGPGTRKKCRIKRDLTVSQPLQIYYPFYLFPSLMYL